MSPPLTTWLLEGDPAVVWQVQRDLLDAPADTYEDVRAKIGTEGWGARLLSHRCDDGLWGESTLYSPKWTSTFYSMRLLYGFGLEGTWPAAVDTVSHLLDIGFQPDGGFNLWAAHRSDDCVTAMTVAMAVHFGHAFDPRVDAMVDSLLERQFSDGGWNCMAHLPTCRVSSLHTTLSVLEALHDYAEIDSARRQRVAEAIARGVAYFMRHHVFRSETTGEIVRASFTRFSFPPRWFFDVLRACDFFRAENITWDDRMHDAIALIRSREDTLNEPAGTWKNQNFHTGREYFRLEKTGAASRWNTLRALRVLRWAAASSGRSC